MGSFYTKSSDWKDGFDFDVIRGDKFVQIKRKTYLILRAHRVMIVPCHHVERKAEDGSYLSGQLCLLPCLSWI